ncbi:MAG TPA: hypothetical protein VFV83_02955 [Chthoniobacteraceae bacterium]|nr:hypothetical protein [Chthoniobacteraceae bacterium]
MIARCLIGVLLSTWFHHGFSAEKPEEDIAHIREELGVNAFTAPSIAVIFAELRALQPLPLDKVWRDLPETTPQDRARLGLCAGQTIAAGFLAVTAQKPSRIDAVGRVLLRLARGLGIGEHVSRHAKSIFELAARNQWNEMEAELVRSQVDVERALLALKDEELAHLVSLGGWLRGLEAVATTVLEDYQPGNGRRLIQPQLLAYYTDRVSTLNPALRDRPLFKSIRAVLDELKEITAHAPADGPAEADVKKIRDLTRDVNRAIVDPKDE